MMYFIICVRDEEVKKIVCIEGMRELLVVVGER